MNTKSYTGNNNIKTPSVVDHSKNPSISGNNESTRVDINILKSKLKEQQSRETKKNLTIFCFCVFLLGGIGVYLSL